MDKAQKKKLMKIARIVAIVLLLFAIFKGVLVLMVLIVLSLSMSFVVNYFKLRNLGIELVTLVAILAGLKFGPWYALGITFVLITYHLLAGGFLGPYIVWVIPAYCLAGVAAGLFKGDVVTLGIYATVLINFSNSFFTGLTSPSFLPKYLIYAVSNVIFNIILFNVVARPLQFLMG